MGAGLLVKNTRSSLVTGCLIADRRPDRAPALSICLEGGEGNTLASNKLAQDSETSPASTK